MTNSSTGSDKLLISNGNTYTVYNISALPGGPTWNDPGLQAIDIDGDGRQDLIRCTASGGFDFYLSQGLSFTSATHVSTNGECAIGDFNGDGRDDIAIYGTSLRILYSKGASFVNVAGPTISGEGLSGTADFNGDGRADLLIDAYDNLGRRESTGDWPNLVSHVTGMLGGTTQLAYTPSSAWNRTPGTLMPFVIPTVTSVTVNDGRGVTGTTTYAYRGGRSDTVERRFLGFAGLMATLPCNDDDLACPIVDITFSQALAAVGAPLVIAQSDGFGNTLRTTTNTIGDNSTTAPFNALLAATDIISHDGAASRTVRTEFVYDSFGQVVLQRELGAVEFIGDERATAIARYPNVADYIVNRDAETSVYAGTDINGTLLARTRVLYDDAARHATAPTLGDATGVLRWLNTTGTYVATAATYDSFGNLLSETDEVGNTTEYEYEPTYDLFQVKVTNPLL